MSICASFLDPLGGVKNLQVIDPTFSTLTVRWDPAVGNVRSYKVFYTAQPDGEERMVQTVFINCDDCGLRHSHYYQIKLLSY